MRKAVLTPLCDNRHRSLYGLKASTGSGKWKNTSHRTSRAVNNADSRFHQVVIDLHHLQILGLKPTNEHVTLENETLEI